MKNKETILREDFSLYKVVDFIEDLEIRLKIITGEITEKLYYKNQHGGISEIDEFGCSRHYDAFEKVNVLYRDIIKAQMEKRKKEFLEQKSAE